MNNTHIRLARLSTKKYICTLYTGSVEQPITGCTICFTVKRNWGDADSAALFKFTGTSGTTVGISFSGTYGYYLTIGSTYTQSVSSTSGKNENYHFDHRIHLTTGEVKVLEEGDFIVTPNVTEYTT